MGTAPTATTPDQGSGSTQDVVRRVSRSTAALALLLAAVVATLANSLVALAAHAAGASDGFRPLEPATFGSLTLVGVLAGAPGWWLVGRTARGAATLRWLVPVVLALSFVPDVLVGITRSQPHTSWTGVVGLMVMHLVVAAVSLPVFVRYLPPRQGSGKVRP